MKKRKVEEQVYEYLLDNPLATADEITKAVGCSYSYAKETLDRVGTPKEVFVKEQFKKEANRSVLLAEASSLTSGERNKDYGDPVENMTHIANIFNAITGHKIKPSEVPMFHIATKLARKKASPLKRDHYVDIMAYVGIAYECEVEEE